MSEVEIEESWRRRLASFFEKEEFKELTEFIRSEYLNKTVYPPAKDLFRAFWLTPFEEVKVVILGQDPYHGPGQAHGLCFSVREGVALPPSLRNIYKEIESDLGVVKDYTSGNLEDWAEQGVFLLNAILTVLARKPASHRGKGWEGLTDYVIKTLSEEREGLVFMLWGRYARSKASMIDGNKHLILESPHPSPLSAHYGFFGNKHFSRCNEYLEKNAIDPIRW